MTTFRSEQGADGTLTFRRLPWEGLAYEYLLRYARDSKGPFTAKDVRRSAYDYGVPLPPTEHAWGGVFKRAAHRGNIVPIHHYADRSKIRWKAAQIDLA